MVSGIMAGYAAGLILAFLGLVIAVKPKWYISFVKWQMKAVWAAEFKITKKTENRMRAMGFFLFLIGAIILYTAYFYG
jgi:uncharacterized protein YjeT (DUF2065 family)